MTTQQRYDELHQIATYEESAVLAETAHAQIAELPRIALYCPQHRVNHEFTVRQVEELIYGMQGRYADTLMDAVDGTLIERGDICCSTRNDVERDEIYAWCPRGDLSDLGDGETYYEHIEAWREARLSGMGESRD